MTQQEKTTQIVKDIQSWLDQNKYFTKKEVIKSFLEFFKTKSANSKYVKSRSLYCFDDFSIRFSTAKDKKTFTNTVLALKKIEANDTKPLICCLVCPDDIHFMLMNSTFVKDISHSISNISSSNHVGSINGTNISTKYDNLENNLDNMVQLYSKHSQKDLSQEIDRIIALALSKIQKAKHEKITFSKDQSSIILSNPELTAKFIASKDYQDVFDKIKKNIETNQKEIKYVFENVDNINERGRLIEVLVSNYSKDQVQQIKDWVDKKAIFPRIKLTHDLGDMNFSISDQKQQPKFNVKIDIKTNQKNISSNPKCTNIEKLLDFISQDKNLFMLLFVDFKDNQLISNLVPLFDKDLLSNVHVQSHWSALNSFGTIQLTQKAIDKLLNKTKFEIDQTKWADFLDKNDIIKKAQKEIAK